MPENKKKNSLPPEFQKFLNTLDAAYNALKPFREILDIEIIKQIKRNFVRKTEDFFTDERKITIAIVGQLKSGKSSLLNALFFGGKNVLPTGIVPKTAAITRIEFARSNLVEIKFFSHNEWVQIEKDSKAKNSPKSSKIARETVRLARIVSKNPLEVIKNPPQSIIIFNGYSQLEKIISDFVAEDGKFTPFVKQVSIKINDPRLTNLTIVDTPGLDDPIISHSEKTKRFIELCDAIIFLSRASCFLDKNDLRLISSTLPQESVVKLILIASRMDDAITDSMFDKKSLQGALIDSKRRLKKIAQKAFEKQKLPMPENLPEPIFVSSPAYIMSKKKSAQFSADEQMIYDNLNFFGELTQEKLAEIGNFDAIECLLEKISEEKKTIKNKRLLYFIPSTKEKILSILLSIKMEAQKKLSNMTRSEKSTINQTKVDIENQIKKIRSSIESHFVMVKNVIEECQKVTINELCDFFNDFTKATEKQGVKIVHKAKIVSDSRWYNPFSWKKSRIEHEFAEQAFTYMDVAETVDSLSDFINKSQISVDINFKKFVEVNIFKHKFENLPITSSLDGSPVEVDEQIFEILVNQIMNCFVKPQIKINLSDYIRDFNLNSNPTELSEKESFSNLLQQTVNSILNEYTSGIIDHFSTIVERVFEHKSQLMELFLSTLEDKLIPVENECSKIEQEILQITDLIRTLNSLIEKYQ